MEESFEFELGFYESLDRRNPEDGRVLEILAQLYTKVGRIEEGLNVDFRLSGLRPDDPLVHYNLACSLSLVGRLQESLDTLKNAVLMGYDDIQWMMKDEDLDALRHLPEFQQIVNEFL